MTNMTNINNNDKRTKEFRITMENISKYFQFKMDLRIKVDIFEAKTISKRNERWLANAKKQSCKTIVNG
jgi:hypothetical protein